MSKLNGKLNRNWKDRLIVISGMILIQVLFMVVFFNLLSVDHLVRWKMPITLFSALIGGIIYSFRYDQVVYYDILLILVLLSSDGIMKSVKMGIFGVVGLLIGLGLSLACFRLGIFIGFSADKSNQ